MHTLRKQQYQVLLLFPKNRNVSHLWKTRADVLFFFFSCVMSILELPVRRRWKNSRQWTVSSLNFRQPYKSSLFRQGTIYYFMPYNVTIFLCTFSDYSIIITTEEILEINVKVLCWHIFFIVTDYGAVYKY